mgnify:CR=1 FL=1
MKLAGLRVLDHRAIGPAQVAEAALQRGFGALRAQFKDLLLRREPASLNGRHVARQVHELSVLRVPHLRDLQAHRPELLVVLP